MSGWNLQNVQDWMPFGVGHVRPLLQDAAEEAAARGQGDEMSPSPEDLDVIFNKTHEAISLVEYSNGEFRYLRNNAVHQRLTGLSDIRGMTPAQVTGETPEGLGITRPSGVYTHSDSMGAHLHC